MDFENFLNCEAAEDLLSVDRASPASKEEIELLTLEGSSNASTFAHGSDPQIERIMSFMDKLELPDSQNVSKELTKAKGFCKKKNGKNSEFQTLEAPKGGRKVRKTENSPFHNYQKHLNNALKKMVIVPAAEENEEAFKVAARDIWAAYLRTEAKTKKLLHSIFNERNEHQVSEIQLKVYGLLEAYQGHDCATIARAKAFLSKLAIDQINATSVEGYVKTRKLRKTEGFIAYVLNFRKELLSGFIKRRFSILQNQL